MLTLSKDYVAEHLHFCINITCIIIVYTSRSYSGDTKLTNECNAGCGCSTQSYEPLCGMDGSIYFTPCHAGCEANYTMIEGPMGPFKASTVDSFSPVYISHNRSPSSPRDQNTKIIIQIGKTKWKKCHNIYCFKNGQSRVNITVKPMLYMKQKCWPNLKLIEIEYNVHILLVCAVQYKTRVSKVWAGQQK